MKITIPKGRLKENYYIVLCADGEYISENGIPVLYKKVNPKWFADGDQFIKVNIVWDEQEVEAADEIYN